MAFKGDLSRMQELDQKILQIQKSTHTLIPVFIPLHDKLRMKLRFYYLWHLNKFSRIVHFSFLAFYLFFIIAITLSPFIAPPQKPIKAHIATGVSVDVVVGQVDFTSGSANQNGSPAANTLAGPRGVWTMGSKLFVGDYGNNRVLIYNSIPATNNASANVVVGQPDFASNTENQGVPVAANTLGRPSDVWSNGNKLIIGDTRVNGRILIFNNVPTSNNASADVAVGKNDLVTGGSSPASASGLATTARGFFTDGTRLIVSDTAYNRVLIWNSIPTTNGASADVVIGQTDFVSTTGGTAANKVSQPGDIFYDGTRLFIADIGNHRILIYNSLPAQNGASADVVVGQADFVSGSANRGQSAPSANTLNTVWEIYSDGRRLFAADQGNHRVLIYSSIPTANGASADVVIGQTDFTTATSGTAANKFNGPWGLNFDGNRFFVADLSNNRVLIYYLGPQNSSFQINHGDSTTSTREVTLDISSDGANQMLISENSDFSGASWEASVSPKTFTLSEGEGEKTVYLKLRDQAQFETSVLYKNILYSISDTTPPSIPTFSGIPTSWTNQNPSFTLSSTDIGKGVDYYDLKINDGDFQRVSIPYQTNFTSSGIYRFKARAVDKAGHISAESEEVRLYLDLDSPTLTLTEPQLDENNKTTTDNSTLKLKGKVEDQSNLSGIDKLSIFINQSTKEWTPRIDKRGFFNYTIIRLRQGKNTIHLKLYDKAGNIRTLDIKVQNTATQPPPSEGPTLPEEAKIPETLPIPSLTPGRVLPPLAFSQLYQDQAPLTLIVGDKKVPLKQKQTLKFTQPTQFTLTGLTYPNAEVIFEIHSKVITLSAQANQEGKYQITFPKLKPGVHQVYAQTKLNNQTSEKEHLLTLDVKPNWWQTFLSYYFFISLLAIIIIGVMILWIRKRKTSLYKGIDNSI